MAHKYSKEQIEYLISIVSGHSYKEIIELFYENFRVQLSFNQIKSFIGNRKLNTGRTGYFPKGHIPFNKGLKCPGQGGTQTQFKKKHKPHNYKPVDSERVNGDGYVDIKIADPDKWKGKHILIWETQNGPVPKGHAVIFGDGNKRNFELNNLILVSRKQLVILNKKKLIQNDADLTKTAIVVADLYSKINERKTKAKKIKGGR